ncbi:putative malate dehydrogenase 1B isoform X1 [Protopterus annectens]|uniref:putative malate dehydrogenase 1B isoform X1 n=1 Tax=Protopterus annectens TaxID=7888 RepID=UPI001CFAE738|nr:putative malate dehydrogenase 1B isoform X1 [Protopterus annectens]
MAKFVVAGQADCPYFAKVELLADYLQKNLPDFRVHKIVQHPDDWKDWLQATCEKNRWSYTQSPIIWRELLDRGGKGLLLGGFNEFLEHAQEYYGLSSSMLSELMLKIAKENLKTKLELIEEDQKYLSLINPMHIWISSASNVTAYNLIPLLTSGELFGSETEVSLHLLDSEEKEDLLNGLQLEAMDLASPLLRSVTVHTNQSTAFTNADVIIMLDDIKEQENQYRKDCFRDIASQYKEYAYLIDHNAHRHVRVAVAGDTFVNLKTLVLIQNTPSIAQNSFVGVSTQLEGEARSQLAQKLNVATVGVKNVIVWGNITGSTYVDVKFAQVYRYNSAIWGPPYFSRPVLDMVYDRQWLEKEFVTAVNSHRQTVKAKVQHPLGLSAAAAIATVLHYWYQDSPSGEIISLGVISEGQFGIPEGIVFSMPVRFCRGSWEVITELEVGEDVKERFKVIATELVQEKDAALKDC